MSSAHFLSGSCSSYTKEALIEHFKVNQHLFPTTTLTQFSNLPVDSMCDMLLLERQLPQSSVEDVTEALASLAIASSKPNYVKQTKIKTMTECNPKPPFRWTSASKALGIPKGFCEKDENWTPEPSQPQRTAVKPVVEPVVEETTAVPPPPPQEEVATPTEVDSIFLPKDCNSYTLKQLRDHAKLHKDSFANLKTLTKTDITKLDRQTLCETILSNRQKILATTAKTAKQLATVVATAPKPIVPETTDQPYLLDDLICKDKKRLVEHMLSWKTKGYFTSLTEGKIKRLNLDDLCNLLLRVRVEKPKTAIATASIPTTMAVEKTTSFYISVPTFAVILDNMIQDILRLIACYIDFLALPQIADAPFGVRQGYYLENPDLIESKTIIGPIITDQLVNHIMTNVLPLSALQKVNELSIPELQNFAGAKYNNSNLETLLQQKLSDKTKTILTPILKSANYKGFLTESASKTIQAWMRKFSRTILYQDDVFVGDQPSAKLYSRAKNIYPRYDAFTFELNDCNKTTAALCWIIVAGTDWLNKQTVDMYDLITSCRILLADYDEAQAIVKKILDSKFKEDDFDYANTLSIFRKVFNDAEVYPNTEILAKCSVAVQIICKDSACIDWLHSNQQLDKYAQSLGGFMISQI
jgi:hypothetical protein